MNLTKEEKLWAPSFGREGLRYEVWQLKWADFAGSAYRVAKTKFGFRKKFWTRKGAQAYADQLNAQEAGTTNEPL